MDRAAIRTRPGAISVQSPVLGTAHGLLADTRSSLPAGKRRSRRPLLACYPEPARYAVTEADYDLIKGLAAQGKAVLLVDENIKRALEIADYVYVMRTGYGAVRGLARGVRRRYRGGSSPAAYTRAGTPDHSRS